MIASILYYYFMRDEEYNPIENDREPTILGVDLAKDSIVKDEIDLNDDDID